jgi:hypothetical protein
MRSEGSGATHFRGAPPASAPVRPFRLAPLGTSPYAGEAIKCKKAAGRYPATVFLAAAPAGTPSAGLSHTSSVFWLAHLGPRGPASVLQPSQVSPMTGSLLGERTPAPTATGYATDLGLRPAPSFLITAPALRQSGRVTRCSVFACVSIIAHSRAFVNIYVARTGGRHWDVGALAFSRLALYNMEIIDNYALFPT